jgi:hypothetical protein
MPCLGFARADSVVAKLGSGREDVVDGCAIEDETKGTTGLGNGEPIAEERRALIHTGDDVARLKTSDELRLLLRLARWWGAARLATERAARCTRYWVGKPRRGHLADER